MTAGRRMFRYVTEPQLADALGKLTMVLDGSSCSYAGHSITGVLADAPKVVRGLMQLVEAQQRDTAPPAVVVATQTVMSGLVLRWYRNVSTARYLDAAVLSASRSGVMVNGGSYLHEIPAVWIWDAGRACELLQRDLRDGAMALATHKHAGLLSDELVEVKR